MGSLHRILTLGLILVGLGAAGCSSEIHVGAVISDQGVADVYGKRVKKGLDLAAQQINDGGGIGGRPVMLVYRDDQSKPEVGVEVTRELIEDEGLRTIIGAVTSTVTLAIAKVCEDKRTVLLSPTASTPALTDAGMYIFRNYPSDILEGTSMADFARDLGLEKVVVFAVNDPWGAGLKEVFSEKFKSRFREVQQVFEFDSSLEGLDELVDQAVALDPEGIYIIAYVREAAEILKRLHAKKAKAVMMGTASITEDVVSLVGQVAAAEQLVYPQPPFDVDSTDEEVRGFVEAYRAKYGENPDTFAAHGYDSMRLIAMAIDLGGGSMHPDNVREGLQSIDNYKGASGTLGFDINGDVVQYPRLFIIHKGKPVPYERFIEEGGSLAIAGRS